MSILIMREFSKLEDRVEELSKRIDDLRNDMNHKFEELSRRIDDLRSDTISLLFSRRLRFGF